MPTRPNWKFAEDRLARFFGTRRRPLSGGNQGGGRDDSMHSKLFLESKHGKKFAAQSLYEDTRDKARKEKRTPVIGLHQSGKQGILLVIHSNDFGSVVKEWASVNGLVLLPKKSPRKRHPRPLKEDNAKAHRRKRNL